VSGYPADYPNDAGPISAKSPVIVSKNGQAVLAIGGAGSDRIVFNTGLALARYLQQPHHIDNLVSRPRYFLDYRNHLHLEWQPDSELLAEVQLYKPASEIRPGCDDYFGLLAAIAVENGEFKALADPRRDGSCAAFSLISP
jgi:gamma-glutamyltranspeptidase